MPDEPAVIVKDLKLEPAAAPNDGSGAVSVSATVFAAADNTSIAAVTAEADFLKPRSQLMAPDPARHLPETREGRYRLALPVPALADPGDYLVTVRAADILGDSGAAEAKFQVAYLRPDFSGGPLAAGNPEALARLAGAELRTGNLVRALPDGKAAFRLRMEMIESARRQINLQTYALAADGECGKLIEALRKKAAAGVEVNVILNLDSQLAVSAKAALQLGLSRVGRDLRELVRSLDQAQAGSAVLREISAGILEALGPETDGPGLNLILASDQAILGKPEAETEVRRRPVWLEKMSAEQKPKNGAEPKPGLIAFRGPGGLPSLPLLSYAVHEKILIVDGARAVVGGRNLEDRYFDHWVDNDVYLEGPVVSDVQQGFGRSFREFARNLDRQEEVSDLPPDLSPRGATTALFVQSRPWADELGTLRFLVAAFQMARRRIWISSQYLVLPDSLLRDALLDAAGRGVDVRILTNSYETIQEVGIAAGYFISLHYLEPLLAAGVRVFEWNGTSGEDQLRPYLHAKEFIIDGEFAAVGSFNLSMRSCFVESEDLVGVFDPDFAAGLERRFARLLAEATEVKPDYLERQRETYRGKIALARYLELLY